MVWRKNYFLFLEVFGLTLFLGLILLQIANAGTLSCSITTDCSGGTVIFRMKNTTNSHTGMPVGSSYTNLVCCSGVTGLSNSCSGTFATALKLSGTTNAHVQQTGSYAQSACISVPSGGSVSVGYQASNCTGYDTTLACMSGTTNAHIDNCTTYSTRICATAEEAAVISITLDQETFAYGSVVANTASSTLTLWGGAGITATNGSAIANFDIYGANTTGSGSGWTLAGNNTGNNYIHKFCDDTESVCTSPPTNYTVLTTSPVLLEANVAVSGTVRFQLQITTPTTPTDFSQQSAVVTVQASAP